ncbi:caspase-8-like isoform X2 [Rhea pennata]|uniref:caspase-8-like isoform X2 n=1 Tax=Rhea pennata TaxID=8795 RepID=UPI002E26BBE2
MRSATLAAPGSSHRGVKFTARSRPGAMEFSRCLYVISEALAKDDLAALKFLSLEHIPLRKQEAIQEPKAFFQVLQEKGLIEVGNLAFLKELLYRINRMDILTCHLGSSREEMERELRIPGRAKVSAFRYLLFQLSENITTDELESFKFLLGKDLPKSKLNSKNTMIDVFIEMEKKGILGEDNLKYLKTLCEKVDKSLVKKIEEYELNLCGEEEMLITEGQSGNIGVTEAHARWLASSVAPDSPDNHSESSRLEVYKMTSRPRGVCLILNNHNFARARAEVAELKLNDRNGTDMDAAALKKVFTKLHFKIAEYKDLTAEEIRNTVNIYQCEDHKDKDCFVCCILSHGKKGIIYGVDGQEVPIQELTTSFTGRNCHSLAGKPKVFFVQACQGDARQRGVTIEVDSGAQDSSVETDARFQLDCIPSEADFLLGMATLQDYVSYRSPSQGTWYIQSLCQHLESSCPRGEDILTILTAVNQEVSRKIDKQNAGKQMPQPSFTLRKKLIFPVN